MPQVMARLNVCLLLLLMVVLVAEAAPKKPKQVKCQDKRYPNCYHKKLYCPDECYRSCSVDCATCQPVCRLSDQPPQSPPSDDDTSPSPPGTSYPSPSPPKSYTPPSPSPTPSYDTPPSSPSTAPTPSSGTPPSPPSTPPTPSSGAPPPSPSTPSTPSSGTPSSPSIPPTPSSGTPPSPPSTPPTPSSGTPSPSTPSTPSSGTPSPSTPPTPNSGIPPSSPTTPSTPSSESAAKRVRCKNKNYPHCYGMELTCPSACPGHCEVDCVTCSPVCNCNKPGAVCQDPRFIGGDGITFYFHGKKDQDFCLVTDANIHINAHFIGRRNQKMRRDFTWVQSLGILFNNHRLFIGAKKTATWDDSVDHISLAFDGEHIVLPVGEGSQWQSFGSPRLTVTRTQDTNAIDLEVEENFKIKAAVVPITEKDSLMHNYGITQDDCFAHLDMSFKFYALSGEVNGVLGQTYASNYVSRAKMGVLMPVLGGDKKFSTSSLFATDCAVARFNGQSSRDNSSESLEFANMNCASGIYGRGVVCKR